MKRKYKCRAFLIFLLSAFALLGAVVLATLLIYDWDINQNDEYNHIDVQTREGVQGGIIDEYVWLARSGFMRLETGNAEVINGLVVHGETIYYLYVEYLANSILQEQAENPDTWEPFSAVIQVKGIDQSGIVTDNVTIPVGQVDLHVIGFCIKSTGEISMITQIFDWEDGQGALYYLRYDSGGNLLIRKELLQTGTDWFAQGAHFEKDGTIAVIGLNSQFEGTAIFWDDRQSFIREKPVVSNVFTFTGSGTYLHLINESSSASALREVDIVTGESVQEFALPHPDMMSIHLAEENSSFNYYVVTAQRLYGYNLEADEIEPILNFLESNINLSTFYHIASTADGDIVISQERPILETHSWIVELAILSPVQRDVLADRDHVVLAGFRFRSLFVDEVMDFNRRHPEMEIVLHDYWDIDDDVGYRQAIERFHIDILAGSVPDIILFEDFDNLDLLRVREALVRQGALMDLYSFIDADLDISREDFFQNVLEGFENTDGELPVIGNWLTVTTMITINPQPQIENWRFEDFLDLMEQSVDAGNFEPLGSRITGTHFLTTVLEYMNHGFIDTERGISYFESDNFMRLLNLAVTIPVNQTYAEWGIDFSPDFSALMSGEQIVDLVGFAGFYGLSNIRGATDEERPPPFTYIGLPGASGGVHYIQISGTFSIFENSQHSNVAWQFVRETLLPGATANNAFSLRIDDFANRVAASTMTDQEKDTMRNLMSKAAILRPLSGTIIMIIEEEFGALLSGVRSVEDTARIIQNRVQIYLHEQS